MLRLSELPAEILEQILLHLPGQDIVKINVISRLFQNMTRSSPALQYRRELFAAGLIDNPHSSCDLEERRRLYREYTDRWSDATTITKCFHDVPLGYTFPDWYYGRPLGTNLLASCYLNNIEFLRVPSAASGRHIDWWSTPEFPFTVSSYTAYPPENILAVAEQKMRLVQIHLLNLLDGSPHHIFPLNVIEWSLPPGALGEPVVDLAMTGSRLVAVIYVVIELYPRDPRVWNVAIWDWKTGGLAFDHSSADGSGPVPSGCRVNFLDEFRIVISAYDYIEEFSVVNTLVPQDHPGNLRRFRLPRKYLGRSILVYLDHDRSLGMVNRDGPLAVDPTQVIFIVVCRSERREVFLILRTQTLIERGFSERTDVQMSWNEWGRDAVVMEIPTSHIILSTIVHGARVLAISMKRHGSGHRVHTFDFSRRGVAALQRLGGDESGTQRRALFEDGFVFEDREGLIPRESHSLGDIAVFRSEPPHSKHVLRVFDMM